MSQDSKQVCYSH